MPFGKWADRLLSSQRLYGACQRFGFGRPVEGQLGRCLGTAQIPQDRLKRARTAAGFGEVRLSAWHGAQLAAIVANGGKLPEQLAALLPEQQIAISPSVAAGVRDMMVRTVREGTARRMFHDRGRYVLDRHQVAGKTGSLVEGEGEDWGEVTWFVGFAPAEKPTVAMAVVLVNNPYWRIRASYVGREALRTALLRTVPYRPTQVSGEKKAREEAQAAEAVMAVTREQALELLQQHVKDERMLRHCRASEVVLRALAEHTGSDVERWGLAGLLHDLDVELTAADSTRHSMEARPMLEALGLDEELIDAIERHNEHACPRLRESQLHHLLAAGETITGLITATTLVYPDKKLASVKPKSITKRMKEKAFAASINRAHRARVRARRVAAGDFCSTLSAGHAGHLRRAGAVVFADTRAGVGSGVTT